MNEQQKINHRDTEAQRKDGGKERENPVGLAEACAIVGFWLLFVGAGLLWSIAVALLVAGVILFALGLVMAWLRSR